MHGGRRTTGTRARAETLRVLACLLGLLLGVGACSSRYKKLSQGGSMTDMLFYDLLGRDRSPDYYYRLIESSHREKDFCYECGDDPYLVDKNIDAVEHLGRAGYGRLEGLGEVIELFSEVVAEDRSALARAQATISMTEIGLKLPRYAYRPVKDNGSKLLSHMQSVDRAYVGSGAQPVSATRKDPAGRGKRAPRAAARLCSPASRATVIDRIGRIGNLEFSSTELNLYRQSIQFFYGRPYLVDEQDPQIRQAIDTALTKRIAALIRISLISAFDDSNPLVRQDAVRGLKTLAEPALAPVLTKRLQFESSWLVRMEAAEYLGRVGTRDGVRTLILLIDDGNASVRHKAHEALMSLAGQDYGWRAESWKWWAKGKDPTLVFDEDVDEAGGGDAGAGFGP